MSASEGIGYVQMFHVVISQFLDRFNFDPGTVKCSGVHFVEPDGATIPFDTFNLFDRPAAAGASVLAEAKLAGFSARHVA